MLKKKTREIEIHKSRIREKSSTAVNLEYSNSSTFVVQENVARMPAESPSTEGIVKSMRKRKKKNKPILRQRSPSPEKEEETIYRIAGNFENSMVFMGRGYCIKSDKPVNQDRVLLEYCSHIKNLPGLLMFGVCDGHGLLGHVAAEFIRDRIPDCVLKFLHSHSKKVLTADLFGEALRYTLKLLNEKLKWVIQSEAEAYNEVLTRCGCPPRPLDYGTTCVVAITDGNNITVANVGDSKIMCYAYAKGNLGQKIRSEEPFSSEHSLEVSSERSRVKKNGGKVSEDLRLYPATMDFFEARKLGLLINMSRALGHPVLWKHGLSPEPEFRSMKLDPSTEYYFVAASDGLWDVISSEEVGKVIHQNLISCLHSQTGQSVEEDIGSELIILAENNWKEMCYSDNISTVVLTIKKK